MSVTPDETLDAKGLSCPMPVLKAKKKIKSMDVGKVLEILATDPGSVNDISAWCRTTGQELLTHEEIDGKPKVWRFLIKRAK